MQSRQEHQPSFHGLNPKNNLVLYSIITALILVIVYILFPKNPPGTIVGEADDKQPAAQSGQIVEKKEVPQTSPPPPPLGDEEMVKGGARVGETYCIRQKLGFAVRGRDRDWHNSDIIKIGVVIERVFTRKIESNDGKKVVELRTFEAERAVKILANTADFHVDPGQPKLAVLDHLNTIVTIGKLETLLNPGVIINSVVKPNPTSIIKDPETKVFAVKGILTKKRCRITTVDGLGVVSVEPVGCTLTARERDLLFNKDPLANTRILKTFGAIKPDSSLALPGSLFSEILEAIDTDVPPRVKGQAVIHRESTPDSVKGSLLKVHSHESELILTSVLDNGTELVTFRPNGMFLIDNQNQLLREAVLEGPVRIEQIPRKDLLKGSTFVEEPSFKITYDCEIP